MISTHFAGAPKFSTLATTRFLIMAMTPDDLQAVARNVVVNLRHFTLFELVSNLWLVVKSKHIYAREGFHVNTVCRWPYLISTRFKGTGRPLLYAKSRATTPGITPISPPISHVAFHGVYKVRNMTYDVNCIRKGFVFNLQKNLITDDRLITAAVEFFDGR